MSGQPQQQEQHFTDEILDRIEQVVKTHGPSLLKAQEGMRESINLSRAIARLKDLMALALVAEEILPLMNSRLGFLTDRPNKKHAQPYDVAVVRDVLVEAMLRGARVTGNEFNIISDGCYLTKAYFERKVREFPGVSNVVPTPGVAQKVGEDGALVPFTVRWLLNGEEMIEERVEHGKRGEPGYRDERIQVKVNFGMGGDAIIGKAQRKIFAAVYARLTGATSPLPDGEVEDLTDLARKPREHGSIDMADFKGSKEPNRGHGDTRMEQVTQPAKVEPEPESEPEPELKATAPKKQYVICHFCDLSFAPGEHFENHLRISHPETQVPAPTVDEMREELRALVTEIAGLTGKDLRQVTAQEREAVWGIFDAITDGQARATKDVPEAMLPNALEQARAMLEEQEEKRIADDELFEA